MRDNNQNARIIREFLRFALGITPRPALDLDEKGWKRLYNLGFKHAILGVVFEGMSRFRGMGGELPEEVMDKGITAAISTEKKNRKMNRVAEGLARQLEADGFRCCLLKGQGNNLLYPNVYSRTPGDIDVWVIGNGGEPADVKSVISYARSHKTGARAVYHHVDYGKYEGVEVELHYRPSFMTNPVHNRRLQKWFASQAAEQSSNKAELPDDAGVVPVPTPEFNAVYQLAHINTHLLNSGFGLRHIIDYYYVIMALKDRDEIHDTLKHLGLKRIAGAMMWILQDLFDLPEDKMVARPEEKAGRSLLKDVMRSGNFGNAGRKKDQAPQTQSRGSWRLKLQKNVMRLQRDIRMVRYFPSECLCEPFFRIWHFFWRLIVGRNF